MSRRSRGGLKVRQFYALIWKDFVVHKRHYIWTLLEITIPVLVCAMAILSNSHPGKPKLENEKTFDQDDYERIYGELTPQRHRLLVAPNSSFTRALIDQIDDGAVSIELCNTEADLVELIKREIPVSLDQVKRLLPDDTINVTIGGVVIESDAQLASRPSKVLSPVKPEVGLGLQDGGRHSASKNKRQMGPSGQSKDSYFYEVISKLDGKKMKIPLNLEMAIRAKDFRLNSDPFPKKYSLGPFLHADHYQATYFMASQIMLSRAYINLLAHYVSNTTTISKNSTNSEGTSSGRQTSPLADIVIPTNDDIIGQRMPYPRYVAHKRLKETTLGTFVAGSQKQKPFVLTMDYCVTVGFLVTAIFLAKRIVDEKKSRVRDMLRLVGISDWTYYGSHMTNTMLIMTLQCALITLLFTGHADAPGQNIDSTLMFAILIFYSIASIMFILALTTIFNSSTKAIIFTSLLWLGLPEILDRIFKMNSGVIESNGFWPVDERVHLLFCLLPNFALRLMNRLLTECDIYGEFFVKKELYGEYRAIWPNLFQVLPLYKTITIGHITLAMLISIPFYMAFIYLINQLAKSASGTGGLASLSDASDKLESSSSGAASLLKLLLAPFKALVYLVGAIFGAPFKLLNQICLLGTNDLSYPNSDITTSTVSTTGPLNSHQHDMRDAIFSTTTTDKLGGHLNVAYSSAESLNGVGQQGAGNKLLVNNMELANMRDNHATSDKQQQQPMQLECNQRTVDNHRNDDDGCDSSGYLNNSKYFETVPGLLRRGVSIRNLCKTYFTSSTKLRRIDAVRNVSLDMFYSQILVLLGHNGAGKTTLIDIISGHNQKSSGTIHIDGYNIDTHPDEARRRVGFCPQFDVLFDRLTVEEHLYFYGIVKGARDELASEMEDLLSQSGLDRHRRKLAKALSGGYKRKLSLAIAMIAKSKVLILDEPTSGMDPESRRKVWDFLQLIRHDRLILMTTHHMEEADALGDRVAVMSLGQVKCCGSALFLKKVFNAGYHLRISKSSTWNQVAFEELIGIKFKLQEKLENVTPHELMYKFDVDETSQVLPALFDELERAKERVGIFGFGVTVSTMDDVFMKIGIHFKDVEAQEMQSKFELANGLTSSNGPTTGGVHNSQKTTNLTNSNNKNNHKTMLDHKMTTIANNGNGTNNSPMAGNKKERVEGDKLFRQHLRALLAKRYQHASRNWFQLVWILAISLACVASIVILIDFVIFKEELTPEWSREMTLEGAGYGRQTTGVYQFAAAPAASEDTEIEALRDAAFPPSPTDTTTTSTTSAASDNTTSSMETTVAPSTTTTGSPETTTTTTTMTDTPATTTSEASTTIQPKPNLFETSRRRRRTRTATAAAAAALIEGPTGAHSLNDSALFLERYWLAEARASGMRDLLTYTDVNTQMIDLLTRQFADFRERYVVGGEKVGKKYIAWYNGEATHSFPISMNIMLNSILKQLTDLIQERDHPLKGSHISLRHVAMAQINTLIAFLPHLGRLINLVFLPFSLAFITSYFVIFPTHERVTKSKHLQLMTGVPVRTFWLSHFLFDLFLYSAYTISVLAIYFVWDRVINDRRIYFANFEHSVALVALVTLFIFGALPLAYIFSFLAKKPTSAFSSFCVLTILTGTATLTLVSLYELKYEHTASTSFKLAFSIFLWSSRLIPSVSLLVGLQKLFALNTTRSICINISPEVLELLCRYINSPLVDDELRVLRPERCCRQVCNNECFDQWPFFWSGWFGINIELTMLVVDACLLWFTLVLIESRSLRLKLSNLLSACSLAPIRLVGSLFSVRKRARSYNWRVPQAHQFSAGAFQKQPKATNWRNQSPETATAVLCPKALSELQSERLRIEQILTSNSVSQHSMVVDELTKIYSTNNFKAVDKLSFVVDKREFFGLLGVNGAGKSTTFKMLTGEYRPTQGNAWIGANDLRQQRSAYLRQIGYCPQQDALIDSLTGHQMLELFARLRGIPESAVEGAVVDALDKLGLTRIGHIECQNYSGGNKRRLSVGMALIGAPEVIFLDEPTSGVDPRSRRRLWSTLIEFQQQTRSAIVMTSHSMNECECLCDRVAIMVAGQFKVLGSIQYLRTKLSQGFSLVLKLKPDNLRVASDLHASSKLIHEYIKRAFAQSQIQLRDLHQTIIQYHIEPSEELSWSKMLLALERAKGELDLEDYQITSDASLESIFLSLAKNQEQQTGGSSRVAV